MKMLRTDPACFNLVGGLGNQLFIYFAGQYFSATTNREVTYRHKVYSKNDSRHGSSILDLNLSMDIQTSGVARNLVSTIFLKIDRRLRRFSKNYLIAKLLRASPNYFSNSVGVDRNLLNELYRKQYYGYFQTYFYFKNSTFCHNFQISVKEPSNQLSLDLKRVKIEDPVMIHIRRGDYEKNPQIGKLAKGYYKSALERLDAYCGVGKVWVFSDDIVSAQNLCDFVDVKRLKFIETSNYKSDSESLELMSKGKGLVIANSTFSFWAGIANGHNKIVVAPTKWFRDQTDPEELIPESWLRVTSEWESHDGNL